MEVGGVCIECKHALSDAPSLGGLLLTVLIHFTWNTPWFEQIQWHLPYSYHKLLFSSQGLHVLRI